MTIGQLKKILKPLPDGIKVYFEVGGNRQYFPRGARYETKQELVKLELDKGSRDPMKPETVLILY